MSGNALDELTRQVARLVGERVPEASDDAVEVMVREVVTALAGAGSVPPSTTPAPPPRGESPAEDAVMSLETCGACLERERQQRGNRAVVTTTGTNRKGLLAGISAQIAECGGDILDVSQTITSGFFTMIMVVDVGDLQATFAQFKERLVSRSRDLGIHAVVVHEEVLQSMQRV